MSGLFSKIKFSASAGAALLFAISLVISGCASTSSQQSAKTGYLVIAHGSMHHHHGHLAKKKDAPSAHHGHHGHHMQAEPDPRREQLSRPWEQSVLKTVDEAKAHIDGPMEVAFGMWDHVAFQRAVDHLIDEGAEQLHVIPLFVNSSSSVIYAQKYQFGLTDKKPERLPPLSKVELPKGFKVHYGFALDESEHLSRILTERARELSKAPRNEELILVAHGPVGKAENELWIKSLKVHADRINGNFSEQTFAKIHIVSLRDDAPKEIRDKATQEFRKIVNGAAQAGREALVLPVLIASGGIDRGIAKRLEGLKYRYTGKMIAPDPELAKWIADSAAGNP